MDELTEITDYIQEQVGDDAEIFWAWFLEQLKEGIRVTVIATGFDKELKTSIPPKTVEPDQEIKKEQQQGYLFEEPQKEEAYNQTNHKNNHHAYKTVNRNTAKSISKHNHAELKLPFSSLERKKEYFYKKYQERVSNPTFTQGSKISEETLRHYLEVPAYLRKEIILEPIIPSPDQEIIHHQLQEETTYNPNKDEE